MVVKVLPSKVSGAIKAPSSKSCTQRALAAALIRPGVSIIENAGKSNDELAARNIIQNFGATIHEKDDTIVVNSDPDLFNPGKNEKDRIIDCGESGLSMRMFAPIASLFDSDITLTGKGSIVSRPMDFLDKYLPGLGVEVRSNNGKIPIALHGPLRPQNIRVDGGFSSQFLTGLIYAFCKATSKKVTIEVDNLTSRPYIDLTIAVLDKFGFDVKNHNYQSFDILPYSNNSKTPVRYTVEGDWSNAAFLLVSGAVGGKVTLKGMDLNSTQGDRKIIEALDLCGASIQLKENEIIVEKSQKLKSFDFDATQCPDLFPPIVALAANCEGISRITGVHRLLHKESNRAIALRDEFNKMNVMIELEDNVMIVKGGREMKGAKVSSHNDHRIAMAATVAALNARGTMEISEAQAVNKSYPGFYNDMKKLGAKISF